MDTPDARPPFLMSFLRRVAGWTIVVWGCALPLMIYTWARAEPGGRLGEVCGVTAWTIAVVARDERLRGYGSVSASRAMRSGAAALLVVQGLAAAVLPPFYFAALYAPVLWLATRPPLIPVDPSLCRSHLVFTMVCGGQVFVCALALGHLVERLRSYFSTSPLL